MRFLMTIHADKDSTGGAPDPLLMEAIIKLTAESKKAGKLIVTGGLGQDLPGTQIVVHGEKMTVTDGPFPETKELIAGFAIFELASKEEALEEARKFAQVHVDILGADYKAVMEVHQIFGG